MRFTSALACASLCAMTDASFFSEKLHATGTPRLTQYSDSATYDHDIAIMKWYLEGVRGLYFGFYRGFFKERRRPQSTCLSADVDDEIAEIMQFLAYGELVDIFKVADSITSLYYDNKSGC